MPITVSNNIDQMIQRLNDIARVFDYAYAAAMPHAVEIFVTIAKKKLQEIVYDREDGAYAGVDRGPYAELLKGDLMDDDKFGSVIQGRIARIFHESVAGPFLEFGTEDHPIGPSNAKAMTYIDPKTGEDVVRSDTYEITGVRPTHWFELSFLEAKPLIMELFRDTYALAIRRKVV